MDYAKKHVQIPFTSIQVNQDMMCAEHLDKSNVGLSYIVGFGEYTEGELCITDCKYNIRHQPLLFDGSKMLHKTEPWIGSRYTLVFHTIKPLPSYTLLVPPLTSYEAFEDTDKKWKLRDTRNDKVYWEKNGLDHPLKGRTKASFIA
jgi:hypothetical protein